MLDEATRREPEKDTLTVYRGLLGSYPNFMFSVPWTGSVNLPQRCTLRIHGNSFVIW